MKISEELVGRLAYLSRLEFSGDEKTELGKDLNKMLDFISKLEDVNTDGVEPLIHMSDEKNVLRPDVVGGMLSQEEALKNAPKKDNFYFRVPKMLDK
ncbi:MAG: aspartyl-tRNA(Asn)/glutamyl-tRNA(Gln) amidotransferase subunit C [Sphingobacteriales bacterium]|jgi:aspartyl-tRNA(Asn)/glutamyl-tRNA(Gln) amidotransferase subunit C